MAGWQNRGFVFLLLTVIRVMISPWQKNYPFSCAIVKKNVF
jgi:hypothetical protein